jgi:hypothetical protein
MNNKIEIIQTLLDKINTSFINLKIIKKNIKFLINEYQDIKKFYLHFINFKLQIIDIPKNSELYNKTLSTIKNSYLNSFNYINNKIKDIISIKLIKYNNLSFYYTQLENQSLDNDLLIFKNLFIEAFTLINHYKNDKKNIIVIWIPIKKDRDYNYSLINKENINSSVNNFNAFTASGVTFGHNPRISILTRYEEINKLMYHELIHNFGIDGSNYHNELKKEGILERYIKIKTNNSYNYEYSLYESYTELISSYLNIIFITIKQNIDSSNFSNSLSINDDNLKYILMAKIVIEILYSYNTLSNIIKLNNFKDYESFKQNKSFCGNICFYEYYFLKALLYNNLILEKPADKNDFLRYYSKIIKINDDNLLKEVFNKSIKQNNFSYIFFK